LLEDRKMKKTCVKMAGRAAFRIHTDCCSKKEREKRESWVGWVMRDTTFKGGHEKHLFPPVLRVLRQCQPLLLVELRLRRAKALGSEKAKC
jgi:hypothetical protein